MFHNLTKEIPSDFHWLSLFFPWVLENQIRAIHPFSAPPCSLLLPIAVVCWF